MALISPGVEVTVIDESQYIPSAVNTVPYFLIATAQNKVSASGVTVAAGTLASNANKTYLITSQRDLAATFGVPFFYQTTTGTPINGYELNEYGLLAAYSTLGATNRAYVQRVDIDLSALTASLTRPTGNPADGTYWLNTGTSLWGIQEWNQATSSFTVKTPIVITDPTDVVDSVAENYTPLPAIGSIGDYAVVSVSSVNFGYYKNSSNQWVLIGSNEWKSSWATIAGTGTPTSLTVGATFRINDSLITVGATNTVSGLAAVINAAAITGVSAAVVSGKLEIYADSTATNDGSTGNGGIVTIDLGTDSVSSQALLTALGITTGEYYAPSYFPSYSFGAPRWRITDVNPRPTGSVWNNVSPANNGLSLRIGKYSAVLDSFVFQPCPAYPDDTSAIYGLDPVGGGKNIPTGTTYVQWDATDVGAVEFAFEILERSAIGATVVTGSTPTPGPFVNNSTFSITASEPGSSTVVSALATVGGTTASDFVAAVSAANIPNVSASVNSSGNIVFTHSTGGIISLANGSGNPITLAGFSLTTDGVRNNKYQVGSLLLTNWSTAPNFTYTASTTEPDQDPATGRLWYYSTVSEADIMIQNNGNWVGYQTVSNDVRGFNLQDTNAAGPIIAATAPTTQTNLNESPLKLGDLWIDTSDLENYPALYRWEPVSGVNQWVPIDTTDQVTEDGVLFADARWAPNGTTDPIADPVPTITSLLTSSYLDLDAPDPALYPQGMLLFNTRRSGYNIKSFQNNYFNNTTYPANSWSSTTAYSVGDLVSSGSPTSINYICLIANTGITPGTNAFWTPLTQTNTWLTASGNKGNGAMWSGRQAQRQLVVEAMKAGLDTSAAAREEQAAFSLIAAPAYPELMPNMIALSNERNNTLFVVGDTPMRLAANGTDLASWATNNGGLGTETGDGLVAASQYMATFYPSCLTTDLGGQSVVQPPSHMMMRTIIRSDAVSYPWLAPAGTRRGVVDNATAIGYIDAATGEFQQINLGQGLRDVLYENDVNPITFIPGVGITNFGNKTTTSITSALDRINVSRLVAFLRGRLEEIGKLYLFEPNDEITRNEITNTVNSLMIDLIAKRAIYDYLVVCDLSNNTPGRIDRNELYVDVAIEPVKAVEFIYIPLRIKNTGEISGGA